MLSPYAVRPEKRISWCLSLRKHAFMPAAQAIAVTFYLIHGHRTDEESGRHATTSYAGLADWNRLPLTISILQAGSRLTLHMCPQSRQI